MPKNMHLNRPFCHKKFISLEIKVTKYFVNLKIKRNQSPNLRLVLVYYAHYFTTWGFPPLRLNFLYENIDS